MRACTAWRAGRRLRVPGDAEHRVVLEDEHLSGGGRGGVHVRAVYACARSTSDGAAGGGDGGCGGEAGGDGELGSSGAGSPNMLA